MENKKKIILSSFGLLLLVGGLVAAVFTVGKQIVFKNKAFTESGTAALTVSPSSGTKSVGDIFPVDFKFTTVGATDGVSTVQFVFSFPSNLDLVDSSGNPVNQLTIDPAFTVAGSKWSFPFNSVTRNAGTVTVQFSGIYNDTVGYMTAIPLTLATANLKAVSSGVVNFTFDQVNTVILTKAYPTQDILKTPDPVSFTISSGTTPGVGKFVFSPSTTSISIGQTATTQVKVNTGGTAISSLSFRLSYPYTGTTPELDAIDITPNNPSTSPDDWAFPVKTITKSGGVVTIDFAAINSNTAGFTSSTDTILATINFKANSIPATNPVVLSFDASKTSILTKASPPVEILQMPANLAYTVAATACPTGQTSCSNVCKNLQTDSANCGSCGNVCSATNGTASCTSGACGITCSSGYGNCDSSAANGCEAALNTATNCGSCGNVCITGQSCVNGACAVVCPAGQTSCSGVCKNLGTDPANCGTCGHACTTGQTCTSGSCVTTATPTLSFGFKVQGVTATNITKTFAVTVKGTTSSVLSQTLTSDANGIFRATNVAMPNVGATVDIFVKGSNTLKKKLGSINLVPGSNTAPTSWESIAAATGDFDGNNIFNIADIAKMLQNYTALSTAVTATNGLGLYDVDNDNSFTLKDLAIILGNFTDLSKPGD